MHTYRLLAPVLAALILVPSCTDSTGQADADDTSVAVTSDTTVPAAIASLPKASCERPEGFRTGVRGAATGGSVVALVFQELLAAEEIKIVWRVTGTGSARFTATGPDGTRITPAWGPEPHASSSFRYPGDEWGTGFRFPSPGCWTVQVERDDVRGRLRLPIS